MRRQGQVHGFPGGDLDGEYFVNRFTSLGENIHVSIRECGGSKQKFVGEVLKQCSGEAFRFAILVHYFAHGTDLHRGRIESRSRSS